ncbi:bifunctional fucokinase/L-fucose-1-P-guanylyltransferase [Alkalitalea saponilacus]|nr:bifunctional fucokinase/L-fucose-1-P-guanylyltransferase [Alkalitalea saponilacus]
MIFEIHKKHPGMQTLLSVPENLANQFRTLNISSDTGIFALSDPAGTKIGSGGGTAWLLAKYFETKKNLSFDDFLRNEKKLIIHAGGQSRRLPAYAPSGKILTPIPVFRWSRGQSLFQTLLDLQKPLYEELLSVSTGNCNTLIASGDVLIISGQPFNHMPEADVVCAGIWADPHLASRHGVFFTPRGNPGELRFMLQKPTHEKIEELTSDHLFMMDAGIWILSDKAVNVLMKKCGWNGKSFENGLPEFYDMYSAFGSALGTQPYNPDPAVSELTVALLPLEKGEFYHYGTSLELITSSEKIQNRIKDQRAILHHRVKPHPTLFVQNAQTDITLTGNNHHMWIENSHVGSKWKLNNHHIITGVPENNWDIEIPAGICLDIIPAGIDKYCIRPYAITDSFSGAVKQANWQDCSLIKWFSHKKVNIVEAGINPDEDIQDCKLFPLVGKDELTQEFVEWLLNNEAENRYHTKFWMNCERWSATEISAKANLKRLFTQREKFAWQSVPKLADNYKRSVFYQSNLKELAIGYAAKKLPLPQLSPTDNPPLIVARQQMLLAEIERLKGNNPSPLENKAHQALQEFIYATENHHVNPQLNVFPDQIVWARSPARLDLAGGWSDTPPYCIQSGGSVVNLAVNLNGQPPLQVFIRTSTQHKITIRSIDNGVSETIENYKDITGYDDVESAFSIPRAALCLAGFHPDYNNKQFNSLSEQLREFGSGLEISLLVAIPKGSGLGTSSILAATILGALSDFCKLNWSYHDICHKALILEQMLTTGGGWQDQYGGIFPGLKHLSSEPGMQSKISIDWLPDTVFSKAENKECWLLYYTGITRVAKNILAEIVCGMFLNEGSRLRIADQIKEHAFTTREAIQKCNFHQTGLMIRKSWELNKKLDPGTNTSEIQSIIDKVDDDCLGLKLLGAGGGGYLLICAKSPQAGQKIKENLEKSPPNSRARFVDMEISHQGLQVSRS